MTPTMSWLDSKALVATSATYEMLSRVQVDRMDAGSVPSQPR